MHGPLHAKNKENFNLQNKDDALQRLKASHIRRHSDITDVKATDKMETLTGKYKKEIPYIIGQTLGEGAYAVVKKVTSKTNNEIYAAKIYDKISLKDPQRWKSVKSEIKVMEKLSHPNIVKLIECFDTDTHVYLIMEKINGCDLHNYVKYHTERKLSDARARKIATQTLLALQYCHKKCITHRDIKLENIIISDDGQVKLIDFGFSTCIPNDKKLKIFCGTPSYMAPEIVQRTEYTGPPVDVWALGVVLYHLLTGVFPYKGKDNKELYSKIQQGIYPMSEDISPKAASLLRNIFHVNAKKRYTVIEILNHPWIKETEEKQRSFLRNTFDDNIPKDASKDAYQSKKLAESIDDDILASLMNIGYSKESIAEGLNNKSSDICRIYLNKKGNKVPLNRAIAPSKVPSVLASINLNNFNKSINLT
jgi:serine/threonine protein kinase